MSRRSPHLPDALLAVMSEGVPALLLTVGQDDFPSSAYTWALALDRTDVRFAADHGSETLANLERERRASLQVIAGSGLIFLIKGRASSLKPFIEAARPLSVALWGLEVVEAKDQSWPGVRVQPLAYEWAPDRGDAMEAVERAVYSEMRQWRS